MIHRLFLVVALSLVLAVGYITTSRAQDEPPLFVAGQQTIFVWDCIPAWAAHLAQYAIVRGPDGLNPCFVETLTVQRTRKDGWLEVTDSGNGHRWIVNPARAIAVQPIAAGQRVAR